jgi:nicotinamidase-related amidase
MTLFRMMLLTSGLVLAVGGETAQAQSGAPGPSAGPGAGAGKAMVTLQMPALPDPVRVALSPATTGLLVLDFVDPICKSQPKCLGEMLPAAAALMERARKAGVVVAYGTRERTMSKWLPEVAPTPGDIKIMNTEQDRFYESDLDKALKAKGITTLIMVGWKVSGSLAYTSVGATVRGYTVVVPVDATAAASDYETTIGFYQILNQGNSNLTNTPLKPHAPTLSRTDMIAFQ